MSYISDSIARQSALIHDYHRILRPDNLHTVNKGVWHIGNTLFRIKAELQKSPSSQLQQRFDLLSDDLETLTTRISIAMRKQGKPGLRLAQTLPLANFCRIADDFQLRSAYAACSLLRDFTKEHRKQLPKIDATTTGNDWLKKRVVEDSVKDDRSKDCVTMAAIGRKCRDNYAWEISKHKWDVSKIFPARTLTAADIQKIPVEQLLAMSSEDYFAIIDLISGKQAMAIVKTSGADSYRKMGLYFYNQRFGEAFAAAQKRLYTAPIDPGVLAKADEALKKYKNTYDATKFSALMQTSIYEALDEERMKLSSSLHKDATELRDHWKLTNKSLLPEFECTDFLPHIGRRINGLLRTGTKSLHLPDDMCKDARGDCIGYRKTRDEVSDPETQVFYLPGSMVEKETIELFAWLNQEIQACDRGEKNPIVLASSFCQRFVSIHPCMDANGRTGRLMADVILRRYGMLPSAWKTEKVPVFPVPGDHEKITPTMALQRMLEGLERSYAIVENSTT